MTDRLAKIKEEHQPRIPSHGNCCTCQDCGHYFENDCICDILWLVQEIKRRKNQLENIRHLLAKSEECGLCDWVVGEIEARP